MEARGAPGVSEGETAEGNSVAWGRSSDIALNRRAARRSRERSTLIPPGD